MIYEAAGVAGVNPAPFTLRELVVMAEGRAKLEWGQTAATLAMLYNINRGKRDAAKRPEHFNPYASKRKGVDFTQLQKLAVDLKRAHEKRNARP